MAFKYDPPFDQIYAFDKFPRIWQEVCQLSRTLTKAFDGA
jgi:hypothetical protein